MNVISLVALVFAVIGAIDYILNNRFGIGVQFQKGFMLLGTMALSMIGMIVLSPLLAELLSPIFRFVSDTLHLDPSILPASLFANDMGGAPLSVAVATDDRLGLFNGLVVSSMMGCTISFTIPFALGMVDKKHQRHLILGLLCGVVTIPIGAFAAGLICRLSLGLLLLDLLPLILFSAIIAVCLLLFPEKCIRVFRWFGVFITALITAGLLLGMINFVFKKEVIAGLATIESGALVCLNAAVALAGMFPLIYILSRLLRKPLNALGKRVGINEESTLGMVSALASSATTFGMMDQMDKKGVMLNAAFSVSGAFVFGGHLAFTMAFDGSYVLPVVAGKLIAGVLALVLANLLYGILCRKEQAAVPQKEESDAL
ncbi:MAG: ethanolamine utilization protein EutH [Ruminococcaceae bacterium]|nr:ethanolamine utilization protein EutH [Oscillospiraceae bacterium]